MFYPANTNSWTVNSWGIWKTDTDFPGLDLGLTTGLSSFSACLALCNSTYTCTHVVYGYTVGGWWTSGYCWLKYGPITQSGASPLTGVYSAITNQSNTFKHMTINYI